MRAILAVSTMIIHLTAGPSRPGQKSALSQYLAALPDSKPYTIEVKQYRRPKTHPQLKYVWGVVYRKIIENADHPKPRPETLNFYLMGECWGWQVTELNGDEIERAPMRRLSDLNTDEIGKYWAFIQRRMSETRGLYIADPEHIEKNESEDL
jgi:hypothetical protein